MASFLYCSLFSCFFRLLKTLAKSNGNLFAIISKSKKKETTIANTIIGRAITLRGRNQEKKQRADTKLKSNNFTLSNRKKANISIAILEK